MMHNAVSVDGVSADENDQVGPLFDYYGNGDSELTDGGEIRVSEAAAGYLRPIWAGIGSMVNGRHLFDLTTGGRGHRQREITWSWYRTCPGPAIGPAGFTQLTPGAAGVIPLHRRHGTGDR